MCVRLPVSGTIELITCCLDNDGGWHLDGVTTT